MNDEFKRCRSGEITSKELGEATKRYYDLCFPTTQPATKQSASTEPTPTPPGFSDFSLDLSSSSDEDSDSDPVERESPIATATSTPPLKEDDIISYSMGRGKSKRSVTARVVSVSASGKSIRTEDGSISQGVFIPSGIRNKTTRDTLLLTRCIQKIVLSEVTPAPQTADGNKKSAAPKKTRNRSLKVEDPSWIMKDVDMFRYESEAK